MSSLIGRSGKVLGAGESVAARDPVPGLAFTEHDGIEDAAAFNLDRHRPAAPLLQVLERDPDLEGLGHGRG